jgi:hypothetical protein
LRKQGDHFSEIFECHERRIVRGKACGEWIGGTILNSDHYEIESDIFLFFRFSGKTGKS